MPSKDNDPGKWEYKKQTRIKHEVLSNYLKKWIAILGRPRPNSPRVLHYVDSFAGRGRYAGGEDGSPIIAMKAGHDLHERRQGDVYLQCYNVEHNVDNFQSLEREVEAAKVLYPSVTSSNFFGTFQDHEDSILREVPETAAAFVFIDPFGYGGVELERVLRIAQRRYHEVFVNFQSQYVNRFMDVEDKAPVMNAIFDTDEWRRLSGVSNRQQRIVELYGKQLQKRAAERHGINELYVFTINVRFPDRDENIYHLIHVSRSPKARHAMEEAVRSASLLNQDSLPLFAIELENSILDSVRRFGPISALDLAGKMWLQQEFSNAGWRTELREALKALEAAGEVNIRHHDNKPRKAGSAPLEKDTVSLVRRR